MRKLYSCSCGGFKFYCTYSKAICAVCNKTQPYLIAGDTICIPTPAPSIEEVVVLSETD